MNVSTSSNFGLVLSGGGARAAYQAGVLQGLSEIIGESRGAFPFSVITGISAGAINASFLASAQKKFHEQTADLVTIWSELESRQVIRTDVTSLGKLSAGWIRDLSFGGMFGGGKSTHLLDSLPLQNLLKEKISFGQLEKNIKAQVLKGVAFTATCYTTGTNVTFFDSLNALEWSRSSRIGIKTRLMLEHVLASSAIPFIFKPVKIKKSYFGDGCMRSNSPLSPAIHLGAEKILAIGVRHEREAQEVMKINCQSKMESIVLSDVISVMFDALFLDAIEFDVERLNRINKTIRYQTQNIPEIQSNRLRVIPTLFIKPSVDLGELAQDQFHLFPKMLRYLLRGIGASEYHGYDLLSYIAFDRSYTQKLIEIGHQDALKRRGELSEFFEL